MAGQFLAADCLAFSQAARLAAKKLSTCLPVATLSAAFASAAFVGAAARAIAGCTLAGVPVDLDPVAMVGEKMDETASGGAVFPPAALSGFLPTPTDFPLGVRAVGCGRSAATGRDLAAFESRSIVCSCCCTRGSERSKILVAIA